MRERLDLIDREHTLSARKQCEILAVHRSSLYYNPQGEKKDNLEIMRIPLKALFVCRTCC
jgi:hypothetical protein